MRRFVLTALLFTLATPGFAQSFSGNWACRDATAERAGILTIYGNGYGFASTRFGDTASGTGTITAYTDGVGFNDGPLRANRNIEAGRIVPEPTYGMAIQLESAQAIEMLCVPR
jgi:hypothetical protein